MKSLIISLLLISISTYANNSWESTRLELHQWTIKKLNSDDKLKTYHRRVLTYYQKLAVLVNNSKNIKNLRSQLSKASPQERIELQKKIELAEATFLKEGTIEAEEARELLESIDSVNKKIYDELNKDEKFRQLQKRLEELKH
jgi:hypothetical protein